jgi:hypothetical protein
VLSGAVIVGQIVAAALLTLVLLFFYVKDGRGCGAGRCAVPGGRPAARRPRGRMSWLVLSAYMRGQVLVATVDAVFIGIGLAIIGLPLVLPLAVLIFVAAFVPIIGAFTAGAAAVLIALVSKGAGAALVVLGINLAVQQLEGNVLYPMIMRKTIELHPSPRCSSWAPAACSRGSSARWSPCRSPPSSPRSCRSCAAASRRRRWTRSRTEAAQSAPTALRARSAASRRPSACATAAAASSSRPPSSAAAAAASTPGCNARSSSSRA